MLSSFFSILFLFFSFFHLSTMATLYFYFTPSGAGRKIIKRGKYFHRGQISGGRGQRKILVNERGTGRWAGGRRGPILFISRGRGQGGGGQKNS